MTDDLVCDLEKLITEAIGDKVVSWYIYNKNTLRLLAEGKYT